MGRSFDAAVVPDNYFEKLDLRPGRCPNLEKLDGSMITHRVRGDEICVVKSQLLVGISFRERE